MKVTRYDFVGHLADTISRCAYFVGNECAHESWICLFPQFFSALLVGAGLGDIPWYNIPYWVGESSVRTIQVGRTSYRSREQHWWETPHLPETIFEEAVELVILHTGTHESLDQIGSTFVGFSFLISYIQLFYQGRLAVPNEDKIAQKGNRKQVSLWWKPNPQHNSYGA